MNWIKTVDGVYKNCKYIEEFYIYCVNDETYRIKGTSGMDSFIIEDFNNYESAAESLRHLVNSLDS